jgi:glycosyltransferase involved in cell wall biosynthesis
MSENPLISIVIATFRQHTSLPIAIRSALNQTYPNIEVVVVPVKEDTETLKVLIDFVADVTVRISDVADYVHQRNLGVQNATGKWISLLDSDDYYLPSKVKADLMVALSEKAYVVYSPLLKADNYFRIIDFIKVEPFSYEALTKNCFITDGSLFLKGLFYEFGGFNEEKGDMAFYDFWLKTAEKYPDRIKLNSFPGIVYCQHDGQMSRQVPKPERDRRRMMVVAESLQRMEKRK